MKIAIMGAGAVGCYYGAILAGAGNEVRLIGRPRHVEAVTQGGLVLEMQGREFRFPLLASTEMDDVVGVDTVLVCVKSGDTEAVGRGMKPFLGLDSTIISLQNSVDNADRLEAALGRSVIPSVVHVAAEMSAPGRVRHHGSGRLTIGAALQSERIASHFTQAGIPTEVSDNIAGALWGKLIINCAYNAISAITQLPYGRIAQNADIMRTLRDVVTECLAVAERLGVRVPGDPWRSVMQIPEAMPGQYSSTAQDIARGRRTEIDYLNGHVTRHGALLGVPTPVNETLFALVKLIEANGKAF
jgi:2-dehydropantoate 2-reductase